jgi:hypothetical protein
MTTATAPIPLTRLDLAALRDADTVSFHHNPADGGTIRASKRVKNVGPFDERERRYEFAVGSSFSGRHSNLETCSCFSMEHGARYSEEWRTVVTFLKAGDELTLHWSPDGGKTGYLERAVVAKEGPGHGMELHADLLYLKVRRKGKRFGFFLDASVCPDNTARMIRGAVS